VDTDLIGEMQRKMDRQTFSTHRLQRAHNRTLNRLKLVAQERAELRSMIEQSADTLLYLRYEKWLQLHGILTPREKEQNKAVAVVISYAQVVAGKRTR